MIRDATLMDVPALVELGAAMHAESKWARMCFDRDKTAALLVRLVEHPTGCVLVAENGGAVIGGMIGWCDEHFFSHDKYASELGVFVAPDKRGGMAAVRLLRAFQGWARANGAALIEVGITTGVHLERSAKFYEAVGCKRTGAVFEMEV